jgi:hypothetical protein
MSASLIDRRVAGLLVSLLLAVGVAPAYVATSGEVAQTHAVQTHA